MMNKNIIKLHLSNFLKEEKKPVGLKATEKVQSDSKKSNKEHQKEVGKKMTDYDKAAKTDEKVNADSVKKYENSKDQEEFHDDFETLNGQEMIRYDNDPGEVFKNRAEEAIVGSSKMGNNPEWANVVTADQAGFTGPEFGKELVKRVKGRVKKEDDTMQYDGMGDVAIPRGKNKKNKSVAVAESAENKLKVKTNKMKRLKFKNAFNGVGNALQLIPENYKVDNKTFQMTDGNENYEIRWEGTLNEGKAVILKAEDKTMISENMNHMKHLMGYKSQDTLGAVKGAARLNENSAFDDVFAKTKALLENVETKSVIKEDKSCDDSTNASGDAHAPHVMSEEEEEVNEYGNPAPYDRGLAFSDNNMLIKAVMNAVKKAPELGKDIMAKLEDWGSAAAAAKRMEESDRFDEVFSGLEEDVNETLSDKQSEEMDTDKDGDIDGKDLANLRKESAKKKSLTESGDILNEPIEAHCDAIFKNSGYFCIKEHGMIKIFYKRQRGIGESESNFNPGETIGEVLERLEGMDSDPHSIQRYNYEIYKLIYDYVYKLVY